MKQANVRKFEARYAELCEEMSRFLSSESRGLALDTEQNARCRAWYGVLEKIRMLQISGVDADGIVDALIRDAESRIMPPRPIAQTPEV